MGFDHLGKGLGGARDRTGQRRNRIMPADDPDQLQPIGNSNSWPIIDHDGRLVVALTAADVVRGRALLAELERALLLSLDLIRLGDPAKAAGTIQLARSRLSRWGGELRALEERLGGQKPIEYPFARPAFGHQTPAKGLGARHRVY